MNTMQYSFTEEELHTEVERLYGHLKEVGWTRSDCELIAPMTLEINTIKKQKNAIILAHSYQTPDIIFGVGDYTGDSLGLSIQAAETDADIIIFAGVIFMAETAKILSPKKQVIVPSTRAGCSLADAITPQDVRDLKAKYPGIPVVCYVNTTADVKAEADICVTSANVEKIVKSMEEKQIIFVPDVNMAKYLQRICPEKEIISFNGTCIVHDNINPASINHMRTQNTDLIILAHSECPPDVLDRVDFVGGTGDMIRYIKENPDKKKFMIASECGLSDRLAIDFPDRKFMGTCVLCPFMKENGLDNILEALRNPQPDQIIEIDEELRIKAKKSLDRMLEFN